MGRSDRVLQSCVLVGVISVGACGSDSPSGPSDTRGFTIAAGAASLTIPRGSSGGTYVKATRTGGYSSPISFGVSGFAGLSVSLTSTLVDDSARVDINVGTNAPGTYSVTVTATAAAASSQRLTIEIIVTQSGTVVFQSIYVGDHHACALTAAGVAYCWGKNDALQNGTGNTGSGGQDLVPKIVIGGQTFTSLTLPIVGSRACGLTTTGASYCWGDNFNGEIGDGTTAIRGSPAPASGTNRFQTLASGTHHTCALTSTGAAYCWGLNQYGGLGDNSTAPQLAPIATTAGKAWTTIVAGFEHTCALAGTEAWCWGYGLNGEIGDGATSTSVLVPVKVAGGLTFKSLVSGWEHNCGLTTANQAHCWGYNATGQLGDNSTTNRSAPVAVAGGLTFQSITAGAFHTCALTAAGVAYCWGTGASGALGDGTTADHRTPNPVAGGLTWKTIAAGNTSTCGITTGNVTYCWGTNTAGEIGDNTLTFKLVPTAVSVP